MSDATTCAIEVSDLSVCYGKNTVLRDFSLSVHQGETVLIQGLSGSGKSTLLHVICGLIPTVIEADVSGTVLVYDKPVTELTISERAENIGIVFQNPETQLFCDTVEDEIAFGLENLCTPVSEISERINRVLDLVDMESYRYASPRELSGGQKQRVVLAAVLALEPKILLLDEALSQLDSIGKAAMLKHLKHLKNQNCTMLMVDHDDHLSEIASRTIEIS